MTWRELPIRAIYGRVERRGRADLPLLSVYRDHGVVRRDERDDNNNRPSEDLSTYKHVRPGDLVVNKMKTWQGSIAVSRYEGIVSPAYFVARPNGVVDGRFMHHLLRSKPLIAEYAARSRGIRPSQWDLSWDELAAIKVALPPSADQRAIADYLDAETARIDALIEKKLRLMDLLEQRLEAGIRARLAALDSPVLPLKRAWSVTDCKHRTPTYVDEGFPVVSPGDVSPGRLELERATRFVNLEDLEDLTEGPRGPKRGDIIYSRNASIGTAAYVDTDAKFCMGQDVCLITSTEQDQLFLTYVLNTIGLDQLEVQKIGSTFSRVNVAQIVELAVPVPPLAIQRHLAEHFDRLASATRSLRSMLQDQIRLLGERRQALISAAVTGEFEIPGMAT